MRLNSRRAAGAALGATVCGTLAAAALASPPSGITVTNQVPKADLEQAVHLDADRIRLRTKEPTDVRVQSVTFAPGGRTGWHHHPGIVIVAVQSGQVTVFDSKCRGTAYGPGSPNGSAFTESGAEPLEVRNLSGATATVYATFIAPNANVDIFRAEDPVRCARP
jgi:predicted metal-dependent enzyme (double-stranded beta helix superfamily)